MPTALSTDQLTNRCDPAALGCACSRDVSPLTKIVGQERAVRSLRFGLDIQEPGFNVYVSGIPGSGRTTAVRGFLDELARQRPAPSDWCYVHNFQNPSVPRAIELPRGMARQFQADMKALVAAAQRDIREAFESEQYAAHRQEAAQGFQRQREEIFSKLGERAREMGFLIQASPMGLLTVPLLKGQPLNEEQFNALGPEVRQEILHKREALGAEIEAAIRQAKRLEKGASEALQKLDHDVALFSLTHLLQDLRDRYQALPAVLSYLDAVQQDMLENLSQFRAEGEEQPAAPVLRAPSRDASLRKYEVNVLVDNSALEGAPVITELNPTYGNLIGRIEQEAQFGALFTDFTLIRDGALHRANGGYLVLPVEEVLRNPFAWDGLKRALANRQVTIEDLSERMGLALTRSLRPDPIPLRIKVILIGTPQIYGLLRAYDDTFPEQFKVKADFDSQMERNQEHIRDYAAFCCTIVEAEGLRHFDAGALARLVEHGSRLVEDQRKLSTHFGELADIIREASFYATEEGLEMALAAHVQRAIDERFYRSNLVQEKIQEMIARGTIMIDTEGEKVGQVNGLSVIGLGDISVGQPSRITASIAMGKEGVVDIEREAKLGGPIHTKGVLILSGYLAETYAQARPLSLDARLVFEQSYSGVEGDSASSTELYALLSALSGLPIRQGIAVTGSVNQKGEVQAIGGVNEKVEGFFEVCKARGLTGDHGVLIPASNVSNLMLKEEVVEAVRTGRFHVWAVRTVEEGIEILTGVPAGQRQPDGAFPEGTVGYLVDRRLQQMHEALSDKESGKGDS